MDLALAIGGPMFSLPEKPTTTRLRPHRRAEAEDAARRRGWSLSSFIAWCVDQVLGLEFLSVENRDFVVEQRTELGRPWSELDVIDRLLTHVRHLVREGKLRPSFTMRQGRTVNVSEAK